MDNDKKRNIYVLRNERTSIYVLKKERTRKKDGFGHDLVYYSDVVDIAQCEMIRVTFGLAAEMDGGIHWDLSLKDMKVYHYRLEQARKDWSDRVRNGWIKFPIEKLCDKEAVDRIYYILYGEI